MNTTAKDLRMLARARRTPRNTQLPGTSLACAVRLLSDREIDQARQAALVLLEDRCKKAGTTLEKMVFVDPELFDRMKTREILAAALSQPVDDPDKDPVPLFPAVASLEELDAVLITEMFDAYLDLQDARTTKLELPDAEVERLVAALDTEDADEVLTSIDLGTTRRLVRALARRLRTKEG